MNAVDTNVLIYSRDPRDPQKQVTANALPASLTDGVLLWQVACEYIAASRKLERFGYDMSQAMADVHDMRTA
jgi:predicted nucleic acid-binding protein